MATGIDEWKPERVKAAVRAQVAEDMEIACKVVEESAREKLLGIEEPRSGQRYRAILAKYRLTSGVAVTDNAVEGRIGIPRGEKGGDYGFWIEVGSKTAPAHPWLRPALLENLRAILKVLGGE